MRRVSRNGGIRWQCTWVNVSQTLRGEHIGFVEIDDGEWDVYFGPLRLGRSTSAPCSSKMHSAATIGGATNPECYPCP